MTKNYLLKIVPNIYCYEWLKIEYISWLLKEKAWILFTTCCHEGIMNKQTESGYYWNFWPRNLVEPRMFKNVHWTPFFKWFHFVGSSSPVTDSHWGLVEEDGDGLDLPLVDPVQRVEVEVEELAEPALLELLQLRREGMNNWGILDRYKLVGHHNSV